MQEDVRVRGALVGWRRTNSTYGVVLRLKVARTAADYRERNLESVEVALNERQLRSFARDLARATHDRNIHLFPPMGLWGRLRFAILGTRLPG
jgi:hypothetical protein